MPCTKQPDPVPINVWPCADSDSSPEPRLTRLELARRVIESYSPLGGTVIDLAPAGGETVLAATRAGRRTVAVVPSLVEAFHHPPTADVRSRQKQTVADALADVAGTAHLVLLVPAAAQLAPGGRRRGFSATTVRIACNTAAPLLRPGGFLVIGVVGGTPASCPTHEIVKEADAGGLTFFQHVVALLVPVGPAALAAPPGRRHQSPYRAHADLLVLRRNS